MKYYNVFLNREIHEKYRKRDKVLPDTIVKVFGDNVKVNVVPKETKLVCKYNITDISLPSVLRTNYEPNMFKSMEIDGVLLDNLVTAYLFDTTGEHIVKYELYDETKVGNGNSLFVTSLLTDVFIPDSVTSIGTNAFRGCTGLTSFTIPDTVAYIGGYVFTDCTSLTSITIPNSITSIGAYTFKGCTGLTNITIPNSVTSIDLSAFKGCTGLTNVTIGNGITSIGSEVFAECSGLTNITLLATTAPTIKSSTFQNVKTGGTLTVPTGSTGYDTWMDTSNYYLGLYNWTKVEQ